MSGVLNSIYNNINFALAQQAEAMTRLQEQASTGSTVNRPSDEPSVAYRLLTLGSEGRSLQNYIDKLNESEDTLNTSYTVIGQMKSIVAETRVTLTQITSGLYDDESRQRTAEAINDSLEQLVQLANTQHMDQYLFGGTCTAAAPYAVERTDGQITSVTYQGSRQDRDINVAPGVQSSVFYVGEELFCSDERTTPVFVGNTGAAAGSGTSSVTGDVWLTVTNDGTNYRISIDDGATWATVAVGGVANQPVTDSRTGKVLYVDTRGINGTGTDLVRVAGTYDVFGTMIAVRDILENDRDLDDSQLRQLRDSCMTSVGEVENLLIQKEVSIGSRIGFLDSLKDGLEGIKADAQDESDRLQEADIASIAIDLSRNEVLYQMTLSLAGRLLSLSLLDFIE